MKCFRFEIISPRVSQKGCALGQNQFKSSRIVEDSCKVDNLKFNATFATQNCITWLHFAHQSCLPGNATGGTQAATAGGEAQGSRERDGERTKAGCAETNGNDVALRHSLATRGYNCVYCIFTDCCFLSCRLRSM